MVFSILLVDSDRQNRVEFRTIFEEAGHSVISAVDLTDMIKLAGPLPSARLVLVSQNPVPPKMIEFLKGLKANPSYADIKIVQVTKDEQPAEPVFTHSFLRSNAEKEVLKILNGMAKSS